MQNWCTVDDEPPEQEGFEFYDRYLAAAKEELLKRINGDPEAVFYERQLPIQYEKYFHWVTARALEELVEERAIRSERLPLRGEGITEEGWVETNVQIRFFFHAKARSWVRKGKKIAALVQMYSEPALTRAVGNQAEILFDAALPRAGFMPVGRNVREYQYKRRALTNDNLDRVFIRDKAAYGIEIKTQLSYMDQKQFTIKLDMCQLPRPAGKRAGSERQAGGKQR